ncbi:spermidine/putrescine-binding protein [Bradyrhizobium sp. LM2.7]
MMKKDMAGHSHRDLSRRSFLGSSTALLSLPFVANATAAWAQEKLAGSGEVVVFSYGGSYTEAVRKYVYEPFTKATGIAVVDVTADIAEPQVRAMTRAGRVDWDVALIDGQNYPTMHEADLFQLIDYGLWDDEALKGTPQSARLSDAVVAFRSATLLAYDERSFPKGGPKNWADFWDLKAFPGPRGLSGVARHMVLALAADGVPNSERWPLSDDKVERALKKLTEIKSNIVKWWTAGGEPVQALINREFVMTSCYDGRALSAIRHGAPIRMVWGGANLTTTYWTLLKGAPNNGNAQKLLAFLNRAQNAAGFTLGTNLAGPNVNQLEHLPPNLVPLLGITNENASQVVLQDDAWLAAKRPDGKTNVDHLQERWLAWRAQ